MGRHDSRMSCWNRCRWFLNRRAHIDLTFVRRSRSVVPQFLLCSSRKSPRLHLPVRQRRKQVRRRGLRHPSPSPRGVPTRGSGRGILHAGRSSRLPRTFLKAEGRATARGRSDAGRACDHLGRHRGPSPILEATTPDTTSPPPKPAAVTEYLPTPLTLQPVRGFVIAPPREPSNLPRGL